jgi:glyoxylase-like metal-dependent hydrolase (beta-lactamase superfamily II)
MGRVDGIGDSFPSDSAPTGVQIEPVFHDGHAPGHTALWLPERRVLIAGDMLSDIELPLPFFPDDLPAYLDSLDRLAPLAPAPPSSCPVTGRWARMRWPDSTPTGATSTT